MTTELRTGRSPKTLKVYTVMFRERVGQARGKEGGRQQPAAGQELEQPPGLRQPMPCSPLALAHLAGITATFMRLGAQCPWSALESQQPFIWSGRTRWCGGRTLTIFNDWGWGYFVGWRKAGKKGTREGAKNSRGNSVGGGVGVRDKRGCKAILTS